MNGADHGTRASADRLVSRGRAAPGRCRQPGPGRRRPAAQRARPVDSGTNWRPVDGSSPTGRPVSGPAAASRRPRLGGRVSATASRRPRPSTASRRPRPGDRVPGPHPVVAARRCPPRMSPSV